MYCRNLIIFSEIYSVLLLLQGHMSASEERVQVSLEELQDLKGVWTELSKIWDQIYELKEKQWLTVQPRKVGEFVVLPLERFQQNQNSDNGSRFLVSFTFRNSRESCTKC